MVLAWKDEDHRVQMAAPAFGSDNLKRRQALCQNLGSFSPKKVSQPPCHPDQPAPHLVGKLGALSLLIKADSVGM